MLSCTPSRPGGLRRLGTWSKTPGTQVQHRLIEAAAGWRNGGNTGFSLAPPSAVPLTFHNLPGVFDHVRRGLADRRRRSRLPVVGLSPGQPAPASTSAYLPPLSS